jgi:hypothetical protein
MGRSAHSRSIIRIFVFALGTLVQLPAYAAATAQGVALNANAGCGRGDLNLTLTTAGANRESWLATNGAGATLVQGEAPTSLSNFSGTFDGFQVGPSGFLVAQPPNTMVGSYAYVGETPPDPSTTAEFFVYYNCTTRAIALACFGPYGRCPQTAQAAAVALAPQVPALGHWGLALTIMLMAGAGGLAMRRRRV